MESQSFPAVKFTDPGQTVIILVENVERKNDTAPDGTQKTWPNGDPMHVFVFTGNVDGETMSLWVRGNLVTALREAVKEAGLKTVVGAELTITYTGDGTPPSRGMNAPKLFSVEVTANPF
jgi:hypothetical protein